MSDTRNEHWYSLSEGRSWPIDESCTCFDDAGERLPSGILVDARLHWPKVPGAPVFAGLSAITVTDQIVTLVGVGLLRPARLSAAQTPPDDVVPIPLFTVSVRQPIERYTLVPVSPQYPGLFGWVVFGSRAASGNAYRGYFSNPLTQSMFYPQAAQNYPVPALRSLGVEDSVLSVQGEVGLVVNTPLSLSIEERSIDLVPRQAIVVKLDHSLLTPEEVISYVGDCGRRPDSRTCLRPFVEVFAGVRPDCNGVVTLEFSETGCIEVARTADSHGLILDCGISLSNVCETSVAPSLPDLEGVLPSEGENRCDPEAGSYDYENKPGCSTSGGISAIGPASPSPDAVPTFDALDEPRDPFDLPVVLHVEDYDDRFLVDFGEVDYVLAQASVSQTSLRLMASPSPAALRLPPEVLPTSARWKIWCRLNRDTLQTGRRSNFSVGLAKTGEGDRIAVVVDQDRQRVSLTFAKNYGPAIELKRLSIENVLAEMFRVSVSALEVEDRLFFLLGIDERSLFFEDIGEARDWERAEWTLGTSGAELDIDHWRRLE